MSSTSPRSPPGASTASPTRRRRAASTPSPPHWRWRRHRTASAWWRPRPAAPTPRRESVARGPAPGTEQERAWSRQVVDQTVGSSLMKRYGTLDEQAAAICFLASDEASYITGTVLPVAGGDLG
ncbi:SDR family oxidoreductase [Streptomyces sp. L7]